MGSLKFKFKFKFSLIPALAKVCALLSTWFRDCIHALRSFELFDFDAYRSVVLCRGYM